MKLNNKGITLVEVIVSFALLMIILVGLFNIIMEVKSSITEKQMEKEFRDFDNLMIARIQKDLIENVTSCSNVSDNTITCNGITLSIGLGTITYKGVTYNVPYSNDNENEILAYSDDNGIELANNMLKITFKYGYVDTSGFDFGFTIVHPLTYIK